MSDDTLNEFSDFLKYALSVSFLVFMTCVVIGVYLNIETSRILDAFVGTTLIFSVGLGWVVLIVDCIIYHSGDDDE